MNKENKMNNSDIEHLEWIYGRMSDVHGENTRVDYMNRFKKIIDTAKESVIIGQQPTRYHMVAPDGKQWIDLDKKNIPSDILEGAYEFEVSGLTDNNWNPSECGIIDILAKLRNGYIKYRYRLKTLDSIRITEKDKNDLIDIMHVIWKLSLGNNAENEDVVSMYHNLKNIINRIE